MSQEVDLSQPLSDEDFRYLTDRGRGDLIERAHAMHGTSDEDYAHVLSGDGTGPQPQPLAQGESRATRRERLQRELDELDAAEAGDDDEVDDDEVDDRPYSEWTVTELDAQLKVRELPTSGSKPDKVKRLEEDDAAA
jgi:hypothetical protein